MEFYRDREYNDFIFVSAAREHLPLSGSLTEKHKKEGNAMPAIISVILSVAIVLGASAGLPGAGGGHPAQSPAETLTGPGPAQVSAVRPSEDAYWADIEYDHYDPEGFYAMTDELSRLAEGEDAQAIVQLYDELYAEIAHIDTLNSIAYLHYCADVTDDYWSDENIYCDKLSTDAYDALCTACYDVTQGPCADDFRAYVGDQAADEFADYVPLTDRESELLEQQSKLIDEYNELINDSGSEEFEYNGSVWTWSKLNGAQGTYLADTDYSGYLAVYAGLNKILNDQVGPIFTQLVAIRAEIAEIEGYDSYADLAYEQSFGRDYTGEEAQVFCDAVKEVAAEYFDELYYSDLYYAYADTEPVFTGDELVKLLGKYVEKVDPILVAPWQYMSEHGMYDLAVGSDRIPSAFTLTLTEYDAPFIFATVQGNCIDLDTVSHEFGHYTDAYLHAIPNLLTSYDNYDLLEIHSTGLEALFTEFYDDIYTSNADAAKFWVLDGLMTSVIDGCIQDEFQRRIYAEPDMTLEQINQLYAEISTSYGKFVPWDEDYSWMYITHTFESPLYYISYAASAMAAVQIWDLAQEDFQAGVDAWRAVLDHGAYDQGYMTVLPECGLRLFTEEGAVAEVLAPLMDEMDRLDAAYSSRR